MDLKNRRIAVRIDDPELRYQLSELLMKNGAVVCMVRGMRWSYSGWWISWAWRSSWRRRGQMEAG
jgi:hypothetical protein